MAIEVSQLTTTSVDGPGVFDVLMKATKAHLEAEFAKGRFTGPAYAEVYLGSLTQVLQSSMQFLLNRETTNLQAQLIEQQILLAQKQVEIANAELGIKSKQVELAQAELLIAQAKLLNVPKEGAQLDAQTQLITQQRANLVAEAANIPKQGELIDANKAQTTQQTANLVAQKLQIDAQAALTTQQKENAIIEGTVLVAQECKLRAEFDVLMLTKDKTVSETGLLNQKKVTELAQVSATGVDADSVVGRQKALYVAQTTGFARDAEQKATKLLVDSWSVRRSTDNGTLASTVNKLDDATIGRAVDALLTGIGA